jgi:hypothetical protein
MLVSLIGVALAIPFFALALVVGAHAVSLAHSSSDSLLLLLIGCCAATISVVNGIGRRTSIAEKSSYGRSALNDRAGTRKAAGFHFGL